MRVEGLSKIYTLRGDGTEKRGGETKILKRGANWVKWGCLKRGAGTPLRTMPSVFTLYFKFLRGLKIY